MRLLVALGIGLAASIPDQEISRKPLTGFCFGEEMHGAGDIDMQVLKSILTAYASRARPKRERMEIVVGKIMGEAQKNELMVWVRHTIARAPVTLVYHLLSYNRETSPVKSALELWDDFRRLNPSDADLTSCHTMLTWYTVMVEYRGGKRLQNGDFYQYEGFYRLPFPLMEGLMHHYLNCLYDESLRPNTKRALESPTEPSKRHRSEGVFDQAAAATRDTTQLTVSSQI